MHKCILLFFVAAFALPAQTVSTLINFNGADGFDPTGLTQASDGSFYGIASNMLFRLTPKGTLTTNSIVEASGGTLPVNIGSAGPIMEAAHGNFYGTTYTGGALSGTLTHGGGMVFRLAPSGVLTTLYSFTMQDGYYPEGALIQATDGNLYGTTTAGGTSQYGTIFQLTPSGSLTVLHDFALNEGIPSGGLAQGADGNLYGVAGAVGEIGEGLVYKITLSGTFTSLHSFSGSDGYTPIGPLVQAGDGSFYATTYNGGSNSNGTFFKITPGGVLTTLHNFSPADGSGPGPLMQANDGNFYGMMLHGGTDNVGTIFKITPAGALSTILTFDQSNGSGTAGPLVQGSDGNVYGAVPTGGLYGLGLIFRFAPGAAAAGPPTVITGSASSFTPGGAVLSGSATANGADTQVWFEYSTESTMTGSASSPSRAVGSGPTAVPFNIPVEAFMPSTTYYYQAFASNSAGTSRGAIASLITPGAQSLKVSGSVQLNGAGLSGVAVIVSEYSPFPTPGYPEGVSFATTTDSSGNFQFPGIPSGGNYTLEPVADGYTFSPPAVSFTELTANQAAVFTAASAPAGPPLTTIVSFNGANGTSPSSLLQGSDGNLYGTTSAGGANNLGTVFQITPLGTFAILHSFDGGDGSGPAGLIQAATGSFYGVSAGGMDNDGTIFEIAQSGTFSTFLTFGAPGTGNTGGPATLIQAVDGNFYGLASVETILRVTPTGVVTTFYDFQWNMGSFSSLLYSSLLQGADGNFYVVTGGSMFRLSPAGLPSLLYSFCTSGSCENGSPNTALIQGPDGNFYGITMGGGLNGQGVIFQLTPAGALTVMHNFNLADGSGPNTLLFASDGNLYGTTNGPDFYEGTIFQLTRSGVFTILHHFTGNDGSSPVGPLIQAADGSLYGMTQQGGDFGKGTIFRLNLSNQGPSIDPNSGVVSAASFQPGIAPYSWITIRGGNLSAKTDAWSGAIVNGVLPQSLDGISVSVGGQPAYVAYISPQQINALAPNVSPGNVSVTVRNGSSISAPVTAVVQTFQPAFFQWGSYAVATHTDYSLAVQNGTFPGLTTVAAKPGETIILWGTGFGPTTPPAPEGMVVPGGIAYTTTNPVTVSVGGTPATVFGAALTAGDVGLYQIAIQIPAGVADGDYPVVATVAGVGSPPSVLITVQH